MSVRGGKPESITSAANPLLKDVRKALARGGLTSEGWCVAETPHLLEAAVRTGARIRVVIAGESAAGEVERLTGGRDGIRVVTIPDRLLEAASQGVVALVDPPQWTVEQVLGGETLALVADGVQDPGNVGTILRSAEAFGSTGVLLVKGTVNVFNPKVVRSSVGSIFRVPFVQGLEGWEVAAAVRESGADFYAAVPRGRDAATEADLRRRCVLAIGSEGRGVSAELRAAAQDLSIETTGVESLNAAVSASILLYEARRQRALAR